jgi:hypothetical protein
MVREFIIALTWNILCSLELDFTFLIEFLEVQLWK